jgi:SAM-dependent methyltransferase
MNEVSMPLIPDLTDPRYLDEVGWFLYHKEYGRLQFGGSYDEERLAYSRLLLDEVLGYCGHDEQWLGDKTVVSIGCGCTGDLAAWPAAVKIAVDPLLYTYQKLRMLVDDVAGTSHTVHLAVGVEALPLLDDCADLVICRNALDHMPDPQMALGQICRILKEHAPLFLSVDIGGFPTPDEPTVFSVASLSALLEHQFAIVQQTDDHLAHSGWRGNSVRIVARKRRQANEILDPDQILQAYIARLEQRE